MKRNKTTEKHIRELQKTRQSAEHLQRLLLRSEATAQRSTGVKTLERLAREMGVYFNNVLHAVTGYANVLNSHIDQGAPHHKYVQLILSQAEIGLAFTESLLAFGSAGSINLTLLNMNHFVNEVGQFLSVAVKKGVRLQTMLTEQELTIMADRLRIGQVFVTLVRYLTRIMKPNGTLTVFTNFLPVKQGLDETGRSGCLVLSIGSADVAHPRPAQLPRTKRSPGKEIELAFSAVRRIIKEHHGAMRVGGQRGRTMEFNIYLPVLMTT